MRRAVGIVPGTVLAIAKLAVRLAPGPQFDQRMQPEAEMVDGNVGPVMTHLLLPCPMGLLEAVEVLFDGGAVCNRFEDLPDRRLGIGTKERHPPVLLADQDHADQATGGRLGGQKGLVSLGHFLAVQDESARLPAVPVRRPLGQADGLLAIFGLATTLLGLAQSSRRTSLGGSTMSTCRSSDSPWTKLW